MHIAKCIFFEYVLPPLLKMHIILGPPHVTGVGFDHGVKGLGALGLLELGQMTIEEG